MASTPRMLRRAAQIIGGARVRLNSAAHVGEAAHQEGPLIHPLLDAAEWVFDDPRGGGRESPASL